MEILRISRWLISVCALLIVLPGMLGDVRVDRLIAAAQQPAMKVSQYLNAYQRITLQPADVERQVQSIGEFSISAPGMTFDLVLEPYDLRSPDSVAEEVGADGLTRRLRREPAGTYKGTVRQMEGAQARFTVSEGALEGMIITRDEWYFVEPLRHLDSGSQLTDSDFVVYKASDVKAGALRECATALPSRLEAGFEHVAPQELRAGPGDPRAAAQYTADLATEADNEFVAAFGGSPNANNEILSILNQVDGIYQAELSIALRVTYQHSWAGSSDPFTASDASQLLDEFRNYWNANLTFNDTFDLAHLWTGRDLSGGTVGVAYRSVVCKYRATSYGLSQRDTGGIFRVGTPAHEIGHNFGASHPDTATPPVTACANSIMNSSGGASTQLTFCQFSRDEITTHLSSYSACLLSPPSSLPDLVMTSLTGPTSATVGGSITVSAQVRNQGTAGAGPFRVELLLSTDSTITWGDLDTGRGCSFDGLAAGAQATCSGSVSLPSSVTPGTYHLGVMADYLGAVIESSDSNNYRAADTGALSVTDSGPPVSTEELSADDGTVEVPLRSDGHIDVNRLTPNSYPSTLRAIRVFFTPVQGVGSPVGVQIRLHAFTGPSGTAGAPASPPFLVDQTFTIPSAADSQGYVDFSITNGPTITSGDWYVGFQSPDARVITFFDTSSGSRGRTYFSSNNGQAFSLTQSSLGNLMVRAVVTKPASSCTYSLSPQSQSFPASGGTGTVNVSAGTGCSWTASSNAAWVTLSSGVSGTGNGAVNYAVAANTSTSTRTASLTIGGQAFAITQAGASGGSQTYSLFVPIVLSVAGLNNSFFTTELTLTNRGSSAATVTFAYTATFESGSGTANTTLPAGRQQIFSDAIEYLRLLGIPIPSSGNRGGTLWVRFSGLASGSDVAVSARTTTAAAGGRAGLAYAGVPTSALLNGASYVYGLRQNNADRSNLALQNTGGAAEGAITLRVTVYNGQTGASTVLPLEVLSPGEFRQLSGILALEGLQIQNGYARIERVSGTAPFYAYGVINDQVNSDGSFVPPILEGSLAGKTGLTLPVIVESGTYVSELVVTNWSGAPKTIHFEYTADSVQTSDKTARFSLTLPPGRQLIDPNLVQGLRNASIPGIGPAGPVFVGALFAFVAEGDISGISLAARTATPGGGGKLGLFYPAVPVGGESTSSAWIYGLQQNAENRTNLALVNTGLADRSTDVFTIELYDGNTGSKVATVPDISLAADAWMQIGTILAQYAPGTTQGYARITRTSGTNPFIAYAVINDGGQPGERSGDGAFITSSP